MSTSKKTAASTSIRSGQHKKDPILIVDDDASIRGLVEMALQESGFSDISSFEDGQSAWEALSKRRFKLVILDWKVPKLSGLALFNRIRQHPKLLRLPIIAISGFINRKDWRLLGEFPFTCLLEKPFSQDRLMNAAQELFNEVKWFQRSKRLIDHTLSQVESKHRGQDIAERIVTLIKDAPNPVPIGIHFARRLFAINELKRATLVLEALLKLEKDCLIAHTELARIFLKQNDATSASKILKQAQALSPDNVERLYLLGQANMQSMNLAEAHTEFARILEIDRQHQGARHGMKVQERTQDFLRSSGMQASTASFASLMNGIGIDMVRKGKFNEGIEHYTQAWRYLQSENDRARLAFNLGLGYLRWKKPAEGYSWLNKSCDLSNDSFAKAKEYRDELKRHMPELQHTDPTMHAPTDLEEEHSIQAGDPEFLGEELVDDPLVSSQQAPAIEDEDEFLLSQVLGIKPEAGLADGIKGLEDHFDTPANATHPILEALTGPNTTGSGGTGDRGDVESPNDLRQDLSKPPQSSAKPSSRKGDKKKHKRSA